MEYIVYTDGIEEIVQNKLSLNKAKRILDIYSQEYLHTNSRMDFYKNNDTIKDFLNKFDIFINENKITIPELTLYDKFRIYKLHYPDYNFWSAVCHISGSIGYPIPNIGKHIKSKIYFKYSVSTSGQIISHQITAKGNKNRVLTINKDGYYRGGFLPTNESLSVHRIVLSTFGWDIDYSGYDKSSLTVNHKSTVKTDNGLLNLEWMTHMENIMDMSLNDRCEHSSKPIKGVVIIDVGIPIGTVFYLRRRSDIKDCGISLKTFGTQLKRNNDIFGCTWEDCNVEDIKEDIIGIPIEIKKWIKYRQESNTVPVEIKLLKSMFGYPQGHIFYLSKKSILKEYTTFVPKFLNKKYLGCLWNESPKIVNMEINDKTTLRFLDKLYAGGNNGL